MQKEISPLRFDKKPDEIERVFRERIRLLHIEPAVVDPEVGGGGKPGEKEVEIAHDFYLGKYEVTQEEWQKVMGNKPSYFSRTGPGKDAVTDIPDSDLKRFPVENVRGINASCLWRS